MSVPISEFLACTFQSCTLDVVSNDDCNGTEFQNEKTFAVKDKLLQLSKIHSQALFELVLTNF